MLNKFINESDKSHNEGVAPFVNECFDCLRFQTSPCSFWSCFFVQAWLV